MKGSLLSFLWPSATWRNYFRATQTVDSAKQNLKGHGTTMGGLLVLRKGSSGIHWAHLESTFGHHPEPQEVRDRDLRVAAS